MSLPTSNGNNQQNLAGRKLAILVLPTNRWVVVRKLAPKIRAALTTLRPGDYIEIEPD